MSDRAVVFDVMGTLFDLTPVRGRHSRSSRSSRKALTICCKRSGSSSLDALSGSLETDLWALGRLWGAAVARRWEAAVRESLDAVRADAERRAARR